MIKEDRRTLGKSSEVPTAAAPRPARVPKTDALWDPRLLTAQQRAEPHQQKLLSLSQQAAALQKAKPRRLPTVLLRPVHSACAPVGAMAQLWGEGPGGCIVVKPWAVTATAF